MGHWRGSGWLFAARQNELQKMRVLASFLTLNETPHAGQVKKTGSCAASWSGHGLSFMQPWKAQVRRNSVFTRPPPIATYRASARQPLRHEDAKA